MVPAALLFWTFALTQVRALAPWIPLALTALLSVGSYWLPGDRDHDQYIHVLSFGVFFAIGVYGRGILVRSVTKHPWLVLLVSTLVYSSLTFVRDRWPYRTAYALSDIPWMLAACGMLLAVCVFVCRADILARWLSLVGRRTLPVYVLHLPLAASVVMLPFWPKLAALLGGWAPVAVSLFVAAASLGIHALCMRTQARYLFTAPRSAITG